MSKWSKEAWTAAASIYAQIIDLPFVRGLADGSLSHERFMHYITQDSLYIGEYFRVLSHIASRLETSSHAADFVAFAADGVAVEKALHESYISLSDRKETAMSPACMLYTSILKAQSYAPVEVEAAAVLPCFWVYQRVGETIYNACTDRTSPYKAWIDTYADPAFKASTQRAIDICDELAQTASPETRAAMTDIFVLCTKMEWLFWESAWNLEKWKI